jgi:hypothetical protein
VPKHLPRDAGFHLTVPESDHGPPQHRDHRCSSATCSGLHVTPESVRADSEPPDRRPSCVRLPRPSAHLDRVEPGASCTTETGSALLRPRDGQTFQRLKLPGTDPVEASRLPGLSRGPSIPGHASMASRVAQVSNQPLTVRTGQYPPRPKPGISQLSGARLFPPKIPEAVSFFSRVLTREDAAGYAVSSARLDLVCQQPL